MVKQPYSEGMSGDYTISNSSNNYIALYEYNCYNQLVGVDTNGVISSYAYAPDGLRHSKTVGGNTTTFVYDNGDVIAEITADSTNKYYIGIEIVKNNNGLYYLYNGQGDVALLVDADGTTVADYVFDAYGNQSEENTIYNPFGYRGEYQDLSSGLIYLRNRYYDPSIGRFITEDPARDGLNWYVYANNNPLKYIDPSGLRSKEAADKIIKDNATYIISAAEEFDVNPGILAATIYAEQRLNVDWKDDYIDGIVGFYGVDTSIGIGQLRISTAKLIEDEGYMPEISSTDGGWNIPIIGFVHGTKQMAREKALENPEINIKYAAAYLRYYQDRWESVYPEIDGRTAILATLYNQGELNPPHSNPVSNPFGDFAKENYYHVRDLLGLE